MKDDNDADEHGGPDDGDADEKTMTFKQPAKVRASKAVARKNAIKMREAKP